MVSILDIVGIVIAVIALITSVFVCILQIKHNKNSVKPYLDFSFWNSDSYFYIGIKNAGIGTMLIKSMAVYMDNIEMKDETIMSCVNKIVSLDRIGKYYKYEYGHLDNECGFAPEMEFAFFSLQLKNNKKVQTDDFKAIVASLIDTLRRIKIEFVYSDIYEKKEIKSRELKDNFKMRYKQFLPLKQV